MSEKKVVSRKVAIALGIIAIILLCGLAGVIANYTSIISGKDNTIAVKNSLISGLQEQLEKLNASYIWLKQHSFTYYVVGNTINISNIGIFQKVYMTNWYTVNGTITNIGDKPIKEVYVFLILRNPDGTIDFSPSYYDKIENLYMGESDTFEFALVTIEEGQTVELFLVY